MWGSFPLFLSCRSTFAGKRGDNLMTLPRTIDSLCIQRVTVESPQKDGDVKALRAGKIWKIQAAARSKQRLGREARWAVPEAQLMWGERTSMPCPIRRCLNKSYEHDVMVFHVHRVKHHFVDFPTSFPCGPALRTA